MKLTDANKIRDYVKEQINPYGKPFEGSVYEFGLKIMNYIDNMSVDYDIDRVVEELKQQAEHYRQIGFEAESKGFPKIADKYYGKQCRYEHVIEIVKQGCVSDDVCKWKLEDEEANLHLTGCQQRQLIFEGTPKENGYRYCPYCGKKIKAVE